MSVWEVALSCLARTIQKVAPEQKRLCAHSVSMFLFSLVIELSFLTEPKASQKNYI